MEQLKNEMLTVILHIEKYCTLKVLGINDKAEQFVPAITGMLNRIIPEVIRACEEEKSLKEQDPAIWVFMLKRILDAMGGDDDFVKIDAFEDMAAVLKYYHSCLGTENE